MKRTIASVVLALSLMTAPAAAVEVVAAGDIATTKNGDTKTSDLVLALDPVEAYTMGDNVYPSGTGSTGPYDRLFEPTWGRIANLFPTVGNHDYYDGGPRGYLDYFGVPLQYEHEVGGWLVVHVDSQGPASAALAFLRGALAGHPGSCEVVLWHHPHRSSGDHGNDKKQVPIWNEAVASDVELVLNGHEHSYERFKPVSGTTQVVNGMGGVGTRGFSGVKAGSVKRITGNANWGVLDLELNASGYTGQFRAATGGVGTVKDSFSGSCS